MDILGYNIELPFLGSVGSYFSYYMQIFLGIVLLCGVGGFVIWKLWSWKKYNKRIERWENLSGRGWTRTGTFKAYVKSISKDHTEILKIKGSKRELPAYGKKIDLNTYMFAVGEDGNWYNCTLGDLDTKMGILDIEPVDRDLKLTVTGMLRNAEEDYGYKPNMMDKYGSWILGGITLIILLIGFYLIADKINSGIDILTQSINMVKESNALLEKSLAHIDNICSGGSGIIK